MNLYLYKYISSINCNFYLTFNGLQKFLIVTALYLPILSSSLLSVFSQ